MPNHSPYPSESPRDESGSFSEGDEIQHIKQACADRNLDALRELATSDGGLLRDDLRRTAWPILLGCEDREDENEPDVEELPRHRDEDQVQLDVNRSFVYYPKDESEKSIDARKHELSQVIITVLRRHPMLHYFQGFHDVAQVLLLVLGINAATSAVARLSLLRIRDFMLPTLSGTQEHLNLLPAILHAADPVLSQRLSRTSPSMALSATLTLYAHVIEEQSEIARLFDFMLASEAIVPMYLFAQVVISRKFEILEWPSDEDELLLPILSKLPKDLDFDSLIRQTAALFQHYPPHRLPGRTWSHVSRYSVLKTTHDFSALHSQTLHDGERFFADEEAELRRRELWKARQALLLRHRKPAVWTGTALFTVLMAVYLRGNSLSAFTPGWISVGVGLQQRLFDFWRQLSY